MKIIKYAVPLLIAAALSGCATSESMQMGMAAAASVAPYQPGGQVTNSEQYRWYVPNQVAITSTNPISAFGLEVDTASYAVARRYLSRQALPPLQAVRAADYLNYFTYGYDKPDSAQRPFKVSTTVAPCPWNPDNRLLHIGIKAFELPKDQLPPLRVVFAIDTSNRMASTDRLPLVKAAANGLIGALGAKDRVAIVTFGAQVQTSLWPTSGANGPKIAEALAALTTDGKSRGSAGLEEAYHVATEMFDPDAINLVVLVTGGEFDDFGEKIEEKKFRLNSYGLQNLAREQRKLGIGLDVVEVGSETINDAFLQQLAEAAHGKNTYADNDREFQRILGLDLGERRGLIAQDVAARVEFNPAAVAEYRLIGYEPSQARVGTTIGSQPGTDIGSGQEVTVLYEITAPDSPARHTIPLRYTQPATPDRIADSKHIEELAFIRLSYHLPGSSRVQLVTKPVTAADERTSLAAAPAATRQAVAVAAFAEKLRADGFVGSDYTFKEIGALAQDGNSTEQVEFSRLVMQTSALTCLATQRRSAECR